MDGLKVICDPNLSKRLKTSFMDTPYIDLLKQKCEGVKLQRFMPKRDMPRRDMPQRDMTQRDMPQNGMP